MRLRPILLSAVAALLPGQGASDTPDTMSDLVALAADEIAGHPPGLLDCLAEARAASPDTTLTVWPMVEVLWTEGAMASIDWDWGAEDILGIMDRLMERHGSGLTPQEHAALTEVGTAAWDAGSTAMEALHDPLSDLMEGRGLRLLYLHSFTDTYIYSVVTPRIYCRWANVRIAEQGQFEHRAGDGYDVLLDQPRQDCEGLDA